MNAIEINGLSKHYNGFDLENVSLTLPSGCIMGLVGENGAGKSTVIKLILNMIFKDGGSVRILGRDSSEHDVLLKEDIGVVLDEVGISECLNARQVGRIMKNIYRQWDDSAYDGYLKRLEVPEKKRFKDFSRGMKMKLGIAIALSHNAKLLVLDEATNGLDPIARDDVVGLLHEFTRDEGHSVLISSHIVSDLEKLCDYIAFLHKGKLMLCEEKDRLHEKYGVLRCDSKTLRGIDSAAVIGKRITDFGVEAIVRREKLGSGIEVESIDIEQLFVFMSKEESVL